MLETTITGPTDRVGIPEQQQQSPYRPQKNRWERQQPISFRACVLTSNILISSETRVQANGRPCRETRGIAWYLPSSVSSPRFPAAAAAAGVWMHFSNIVPPRTEPCNLWCTVQFSRLKQDTASVCVSAFVCRICICIISILSKSVTLESGERMRRDRVI